MTNEESTDKVESLVNSNKKYDESTFKRVFDDKNETEKLYNSFKSYVEENGFPDADSYYKIELREIKDDKEFEYFMDKFRVTSRQAIISDKNRLLFTIRQEELYTTINSLQDKLDKYDNFVKEHGEEAAAREYTNAQLNEIHMIRSQSIPMYLVELETLASAVRDNNQNYEDNLDNSLDYAVMLSRYIKSHKM